MLDHFWRPKIHVNFEKQPIMVNLGFVIENEHIPSDTIGADVVNTFPLVNQNHQKREKEIFGGVHI